MSEGPSTFRNILLLLITIALTVSGTLYVLDSKNLLEPTIEVQQVREVVTDETIQEFVNKYLDSVEPNAYEVTNTEVVRTDLEALNNALTSLVEKVDFAVIGVANIGAEDTWNGTGSGVVYKYEDGYYFAITNNHVIEDSVSLEVYFEDLSHVVAYLVGTDAEADVAVIKFQSPTEIVPVVFGDPKTVERGQLVVAMGSPSGFDYINSATLGMVSGVDRFVGTADTDGDGYDDVFSKMLQHDTAINPGNSGGPLFDLNGQLIGINTLKLVDSTIEGMGFAIPMDIVERVIVDLEAYGEVQRARIGIWVKDIRYYPEIETSLTQGAYVDSIVDGGPADTTSDLIAGDIITMFNGEVVTGTEVLKDILFQLYPGDVVSIGFDRNGTYMETSIELGSLN